MAQLIVSALGPDRPGIVGEVTSRIHQAGGNLLDSRMVNLRGEFALMVLLECSDETARKLTAELPAAGEKIGLQLVVRPLEAETHAVDGLRYRLKTYSLDQPGIVARLSNLLRQHGVNIEELTARQESAPFAGGPLFTTEMRLTVPGQVPLRKLRTDLESLCNDLNCDVDLDPDD
jgi:glycine cleavage system transcriptional repressor